MLRESGDVAATASPGRERILPDWAIIFVSVPAGFVNAPDHSLSHSVTFRERNIVARNGKSGKPSLWQIIPPAEFEAPPAESGHGMFC